jgi:hypothetical protein
MLAEAILRLSSTWRERLLHFERETPPLGERDSSTWRERLLHFERETPPLPFS